MGLPRSTRDDRVQLRCRRRDPDAALRGVTVLHQVNITDRLPAGVLVWVGWTAQYPVPSLCWRLEAAAQFGDPWLNPALDTPDDIWHVGVVLNRAVTGAELFDVFLPSYGVPYWTEPAWPSVQGGVNAATLARVQCSASSTGSGTLGEVAEDSETGPTIAR